MDDRAAPIHIRVNGPGGWYNSGRNSWAPKFLARRPDVTLATVETYLHNLYRARPDFVYSVSRDFVRNCQTPMLVMPDDTPAHPYQSSMDVAALAPRAELTVYPWREPPELLAQTIDHVRRFLRAQQPASASQ